ncbi:TPA: hypothetical protein JGU28_004427 [Salmonella enterica]|nr:hypothetical protein [Salmonella enterica]
MKTYTLDIDNARNIRFTGEIIGSAASSDNNAMGHSYSGETGRWTELRLYRTSGGNFVCHQIERTCWQGQRDCFRGKICKNLKEVFEFFGYGWLAKDLYDDAGLEYIKFIE